MYVQKQYPSLRTHAHRLPQIIRELGEHLSIVKDCCTLDGKLYISRKVFQEEVMEVDPNVKDLAQLRNYARRERRQILRVLNDHFSLPELVPSGEIQELRELYHNPDVRPDDRDASLIVVSINLAKTAGQTIILTSDRDFVDSIRILMKEDTISIGGRTLPTNRIMSREYFLFIVKLHDCCELPTARYEPLAEAYHSLLIRRKLRRQGVFIRDTAMLKDIWGLHTQSIRIKEEKAA